MTQQSVNPTVNLISNEEEKKNNDLDLILSDRLMKPDDVKNPIRMKFTIKTLENFDSVYFEELADELDLHTISKDKKDTVMSSYWVDMKFGKFH